MSFRLGLTGSMGMGKSTTARMFADEGCALWDADAAVHRLYAPGGGAVAPMAEAFPAVLDQDAISRDRLRGIIAADPTALKRIEAIVHPLVRRDREAFAAATGASIVVFDIPLLFETGGEAEMDATACVSVPVEEQRARILARGTMSEEDVDRILARQMPNDEKCRRADYVIHTDTLETAYRQVQDVLMDIRARKGSSHA